MYAASGSDVCLLRVGCVREEHQDVDPLLVEKEGKGWSWLNASLLLRHFSFEQGNTIKHSAGKSAAKADMTYVQAAPLI